MYSPLFYEQFPDGKVPIRHLPASKFDPLDDFVKWAQDITTRHDALAHLSVGNIEVARNAYWEAEANIEGLSGYERRNTMRSHLMAALAAPLAMSVAAAYFGISSHEALCLIVGHEPTNVAGLLQMSAAVVAGDRRRMPLAVECGFPHARSSARTVEFIRRCHCPAIQLVEVVAA